MSFTAALTCNHPVASTCPSCKSIPLTTSLFTAAEWGRADLVEKALSRGASPNQVDAGGYTAMHYAAQRNHVAVIQLLASKGANVNAHDCGATPLHRAAFAGSLEACVLLLRLGADATLVDGSFSSALPTALDKARAQQHEGIVKLLLTTPAPSSTT